jgi:hypothetical protein
MKDFKELKAWKKAHHLAEVKRMLASSIKKLNAEAEC